MNTKTISGHYDSIYSVAHNNRVIVSKNVDVLRSGNNYYCVAAGQSVSSETLEPQFLCDFWREYRTLADYYWEDRAIARQAEYERYRKSMQRLHELSKAWCAMPNDPVLAWIWLLTLPLRMPCGIYLTYQQRQVQKEWEDFKTTIHISDLYDILSYSEDSSSIAIEVKSTPQKDSDSCRLTKHEQETAEKLTSEGIDYKIYFLTGVGTEEQDLSIVDYRELKAEKRIEPATYQIP